ncbi:ABC transporter permease [Cohnella fermenti]|uniref:Putative hemin transport system permease protein HrtB n=1 Tax=Cohnella fermenti TaxID=2565925 RepID=A0A4S4C212_9BACL|nr:ABC transporter permease [Cohnella fermenti]THF81711.1 ABC transporter permease [Cohnella fermenti]
MKLAWQEMKRNRARFAILGSIVFLISLLAFIVAGLANGLSRDNAALIADMPEGQFYMSGEADGTYSFSAIDPSLQSEVLQSRDGSMALSIRLGFLNDADGKQLGVAYVASVSEEENAKAKMLPTVHPGEVWLDGTLAEKGVAIGDMLTGDASSDKAFRVAGFVDGQKFSHAPAAFVNPDDYAEMTGRAEMQLLFVPGSPGETPAGLEAFTKGELLGSIPSYKAEQLTLNMIIVFLIAIGGLLFGIFFYMMNVQKMGLYGILKAIGVRTGALFRMMWTQMAVVAGIAMLGAAALSALFAAVAPGEMPFRLSGSSMAWLAVLFLVVGFAGSSVSGIQIKKVSPLAAIQQGEM